MRAIFRHGRGRGKRCKSLRGSAARVRRVAVVQDALLDCSRRGLPAPSRFAMPLRTFVRVPVLLLLGLLLAAPAFALISIDHGTWSAYGGIADGCNGSVWSEAV